MARNAASGNARPVGTFAPLRVAMYRRIWIASLASNFGQLILGVGAAWEMTRLATSPDMVALVQTALMLPMMLVALPAGALADMFDRRKIAMTGLSLAIFFASALASLSYLELTTPWLLLAMCSLIGAGVLDRFPKLTFVLPHAGGAFPWLVGRLHRGWEKRADLKHIEQGPTGYLRRFYYDTIGYSDPVVEYLVKNVGADRVLMGSDYCFPVAYEQPVEVVVNNPLIAQADRHAILEGNARRLLGL